MWIGGTTALVTGSIQPMAWAASEAAETVFFVMRSSYLTRSLLTNGLLTNCLRRNALITLQRVHVSQLGYVQQGNEIVSPLARNEQGSASRGTARRGLEQWTHYRQLGRRRPCSTLPAATVWRGHARPSFPPPRRSPWTAKWRRSCATSPSWPASRRAPSSSISQTLQNSMSRSLAACWPRLPAGSPRSIASGQHAAKDRD